MLNFLNGNFNKTIVAILIVSILATSVLPLSVVYAQSIEGGYGSEGGAEVGSAYPSSGARVTGGIKGYIDILGPAISQLPLCQEKINSKVKGLFRDVSSTLKEAEVKEFESKLGPDDDAYSAEAIEVIDSNTQKKLQELQKQTKEIKKITEETNENDTCLKSIGRLVTKMLLQKITVSTVEWINNGFEGKPLFLENPTKFFGDIARNEFLQFKLEIDDPTLYPFGRAFLKSQVNALNNRFADNARYSLNELISQTTPEYNAITFGKSFEYGGWNAWDALTQVPANNPIGFNIIASTELSARLEGTSFSKGQEAQKNLDQSGGFLGDERCVEPPGLSRAEHNANLIRGKKIYEEYVENVEYADADNEAGSAQITKQRWTGEIEGVCKKWEYVTPGKLIAESATKVIGYPDNNLLKSEDLNSAIAAIMDALLNRWTADIANKGFANFDTEGSDGSFIYDDDNKTIGGTSQTELDFPKGFLNTNWLRDNPNFNIRTDLTQALIDEQRIYKEKLEEENRTLNDLITTAYQLDYCIPGPNPEFEDSSERTLNAVKRTILSKSAADFKNVSLDQILGLVKSAGYIAGAAIGASIGTAVLPVVGTAIGAAIGFLIGALVDFFAGASDEEKVDVYYAAIFRILTGVQLSKENTKFAKISGKGDVTNALDAMFDRYIKLIKKHYPKAALPDVTPYAKIEFRKIKGYRETIAKNEYSIANLNGIILRLGKLKDQLDAINNPETTPYETYLPMINEFSRLSATMVTGNDISSKIDDINESKDQIKYVYEDLIAGPYGCEKELELDKNENKLDPQIRATLRTEYPFAIWYDYNQLGPGNPIPDPDLTNFMERYNIKKPAQRLMPAYHPGPFNAGSSQFGPGFLSPVAMAYNLKTPSDPKQTCADFKAQAGYGNILDCLYVGDLFYNVNSWPVSVGRKQGTAINGEGADKNFQKDVSFEQTIGVY